MSNFNRPFARYPGLDPKQVIERVVGRASVLLRLRGQGADFASKGVPVARTRGEAKAPGSGRASHDLS